MKILLALLLLIPNLSWGDLHSYETVISCKGDFGYNHITEQNLENFNEYKYQILFFEDENGVLIITPRFERGATGTYNESSIYASEEGDTILDTSMNWNMQLNRINGEFTLEYKWRHEVKNELIAWWYETGKCFKSQKAF